MLTLIPEQERSIDYRFEFAIVGEGARSFAEAAVNSEMAEAFRPTAKAEGTDQTEDANLQGNDSGAEAFAPTSSKRPGNSSAASSKQKLILFCPIGENTKALARVKLTVVENFSESLPLVRDAQVAMNQAIVFLFYPDLVAGCRSPGKSSPFDEFKRDFISRWAEINHSPEQFRPYARILCIEVEPDVEELVEALGKTKNVSTDSQPDYAEDSVMESLQTLCEHLISRQAGRATKPLENGTTPMLEEGGPTVKSSCCVLL